MQKNGNRRPRRVAVAAALAALLAALAAFGVLPPGLVAPLADAGAAVADAL